MRIFLLACAHRPAPTLPTSLPSPSAASIPPGDQLAAPFSTAQVQLPALLNVAAKMSSSTRIQTLAFQAYHQVGVAEDEAVEVVAFQEAEPERRG
jgi:hypothetical protein